MPAAIDIVTERLAMRRPVPEDAEAIYTRYASDPAVCRYLAWPMHRSVQDSVDFIAFSDAEWRRGPVGPLLVFRRDTGSLIGGTGLAFDDGCASTGYVFARDAWGRGYATETLLRMCELAGEHGVSRLYSLVHPEHVASRRVLEKAGFEREALLSRHFEFPNLAPGRRLDALRYVFRGRKKENGPEAVFDD